MNFDRKIKALVSVSLFGVILLFCVGHSFGQFSKKAVQRKDIPSFIASFDASSERARLLAKHDFVDATKYLPRNYKRSGNVDYTKQLQKAISENRYVIMPNFTVLINDKGLDIPSNRVIVFQDQSKLKMKPSNKTNFAAMNLRAVSNVLLFSPTIEGERHQHLSSKGEWGMGISVLSSRNIQIINAHITDNWGDGIYLGQTGPNTNRNITINHGLIDGNRRNGISVITARGLTISNLIISNTHGTNPAAGIDFEPNNSTQILQDIRVENIFTFNNFNQGIFICLNEYNNSSNPIDIVIRNHYTLGSPTGIGVMANKKPAHKSVKINGRIDLEHIDYGQTRDPIRFFSKDFGNLNLKVRPKVKKKYTVPKIPRVTLE